MNTVFNYQKLRYFSVWFRTGSNQADINRFRSHIEIVLLCLGESPGWLHFELRGELRLDGSVEAASWLNCQGLGGCPDGSWWCYYDSFVETCPGEFIYLCLSCKNNCLQIFFAKYPFSLSLEKYRKGGGVGF